MRHRSAAARLAAIAAVLATAGCATVGPGPSPTAPPLTAGTGTVLTVRPIVADWTDGGAWRAAMLDGAVASPAAPRPPGAALAEFIIREDTGATISIVQTNTDGLRRGGRVQITRPSSATGRPGLIPLL